MFSKYVYIRYYKTVVHYQREKHVADLRWVPGFGMTDSTWFMEANEKSETNKPNSDVWVHFH